MNRPERGGIAQRIVRPRSLRKGLAESALLGLMVLATPQSGSANPALSRVVCLRLDAGQPQKAEIGRAVGLGREELSSNLLVAVKAKLPRLPLREDCAALLYLRILLLEARAPAGLFGYSGLVELSVHRNAIIEPDAPGSPDVWVHSELPVVPVWADRMVFVASSQDTRMTVLDAVDRLVTALEAAYYQAGNQ